jgi:hypothetical protein
MYDIFVCRKSEMSRTPNISGLNIERCSKIAASNFAIKEVKYITVNDYIFNCLFVFFLLQ